MTTDHTPSTGHPVHLNGTSQLIQAVPYLLGHHGLHDDVIILATHHRRTVLTARTDLNLLTDASLWTHTTRALNAADARTIHLIAYPTRIDDTVLTSLHEAYRTLAATSPTGLVLAQTLTVCEGSWWTHNLHAPAPHGPGTPLVTDDALDLDLSITHGTPAPSREQVLAALAPHPPTVRTAVRDTINTLAATSHPERLHTATQALQRRSARPMPWTIHEAANVLAALQDVIVRDTMALDCTAEHASWTWTTLLPYAPTTHTAPVATLAAMTAHQNGNGILTHACLQRALDTDPHYRLAQLFRQALHHALTPEDIRHAVLAPSRQDMKNQK